MPFSLPERVNRTNWQSGSWIIDVRLCRDSLQLSSPNTFPFFCFSVRSSVHCMYVWTHRNETVIHFWVTISKFSHRGEIKALMALWVLTELNQINVAHRMSIPGCQTRLQLPCCQYLAARKLKKTSFIGQADFLEGKKNKQLLMLIQYFFIYLHPISTYSQPQAIIHMKATWKLMSCCKLLLNSTTAVRTPRCCSKPDSTNIRAKPLQSKSITHLHDKI